MTHLIVTEKHDAAMRISGILSKGDSTRTTVNNVPVYTWDNYKTIGLAGHVVEIDFPEQYNDWNAVDPSALLDAPVETTPSKPDLVNAVKTLTQEANKATIATDYDREGELIGKEAHDIIKNTDATVDVDRVRFSSITAPEIYNAFDNHTTIDFDLAAAGEARQIIDLVWGASLTRFLTLNADRNDRSLLSVGRVQTPTLKLVVDREREIENFDPDDYWEITTDVTHTSDETDAFEAQYYTLDTDDNETTRLWSEPIAESVYNEINAADTATVTGVDAYTKNDYPPTPFDTTEFIKAANAIGYNAKPAMSIAEDLYTDGYITYPRTDNTVYPDDLDPEELVETLGDELQEFEDDAENLLSKDDLTPTEGDTESTDHPPIHPTTSPPNKTTLSDDEWEIYELVVRRFLATVSDKAVWAHVRLDLDANGHNLKANGKNLIEPGYHTVYPYYNTDENTVPELDENTDVTILNTHFNAKQTQPPNRYNQSKLIDKMKALNLGTKSTRHNTIDKLYDRDYITGDPPHPTETARAVITAVESYAEPITTPDMTAALEDDMDAIADGNTSLDTVVDDSRDMLHEVFNSLEQNRSEVASLLSDDKTGTEEADPDIVGPCPECDTGTLVIRNPNDSYFIGCDEYPECEYTLPVPNKGRPHVLDDVCDTHDLHEIKMIAGKKTFVHGCPACQAEKADDTDDRVIGDCPECEGDLSIKRVPSGSRLVGCTNYPDCDYSLPLPRDGDIEITDETCDEHDLPELVVHKDEGSPWELGCPICNYQNYKS